MQTQIVVIGSSNVDFIMQVERLPQVGETVTDGVFFQTYGGKGANQAVAAARAGGNVLFMTGLGQDTYGATILENFQRDNIKTSRIVFQPDVPTGSALVMFDRHGDNYLTVAPGANYALEPAHIAAVTEDIARADMLVLQMEIPIPTTLRALEVAHKQGIPTLFNYAPVRDCAVPVSEQMQILVVNEHEAAALTDTPVKSLAAAEKAAQSLRARGPQIVVLTLGASGAVVASSEFTGHLPAFAVTPVDTTAAGDVFCGALGVALVEKRSLREAVLFANAASALSVTFPGAQSSIPARVAIDTFLQTHQNPE